MAAGQTIPFVKPTDDLVSRLSKHVWRLRRPSTRSGLGLAQGLTPSIDALRRGQ